MTSGPLVHSARPYPFQDRRDVPSTATEFERLIRDHARLMAAAIRRICGRRHGGLVADVQQEVYLALWKRLQSGNEIAHPISYLYKVALTTALAVIRRLEPEHSSLLSDDALPAAREDTGLNPLERARLIEQALEALEPEEARALRAYLAGFNHQEVARLFGWTESVARHRIYRSMERLRERMGR
jgi:RNA polymerase sigma-70 factor (ECF subfamily)